MVGDLVKRGKATRVALDRDDFSRPFRKKRPREPAWDWADFDDGSIGQRASGARDAAGEIEIEKKMLAQGFFCQEPMRGGDFAQRRKAVEPARRDGSRPGFSHFWGYRA